MRRVLVRLAVLTTLVGMLALAVPLLFVAHSLLISRQIDVLQRSALLVAARTDGASLGTGDSVELPHLAGQSVVLFDATGLELTARGRRIPGGVAATDPLVRLALTGAAVHRDTGRELGAAVAIASGERVYGAVLVSSPSSVVWVQTGEVATGVVLVACLALSLAWGVARRRARAVSRPAEQLAQQVLEFGAAPATVAFSATGLPEFDAVSDALTRATGRLSDALRREREFNAHASHQLRTPLTGLQIILEGALLNSAADTRAALTEALEVSRRLENTIEDVLTLTRPAENEPVETFDDGPGTTVADVAELAERWNTDLARRGRRTETTLDPDLPSSMCPASATRQILDVVVANALVHGSGTVRIRARQVHGLLLVDVGDEGHEDPKRLRTALRAPGVGGTGVGGTGVRGTGVREDSAAGGDRKGMGLAFACQVADTHGARISLTSVEPTTVTVTFPRGHPGPPSTRLGW